MVGADQLDFEGVATLEYLRQGKWVLLIDSLVAGNLQTLDSCLPNRSGGHVQLWNYTFQWILQVFDLVVLLTVLLLALKELCFEGS